ncbi:TolC family protein [Chitinophaga vietnamensis]|uniref:TolC family protein n=1 Tax=Chitinophaga vietnamensis TaxID=2593957 RepID=UPI0011777C76|nr:TolC family protein [Chitinophaga vietnamensis]
MKKLLLFVLSLTTFLMASAQQKDSIDLATVQSNPALEARFKQTLVALARNNPNQDGYKAKEKINKYEIQNAKAAWLNHFMAAANVNEYSLKNSSTINGQNYYYPKYNLGFSISLGDLLTTPNNVKIAKTNREVIEALKEKDLRDARTNVLKQYETYIANKKLFELHLPLLEDAYSNYQSQEKKFSAGEVSIEIYNSAYRVYNAEMVQNVVLAKNMNESKIDLEGAINMPLEAALQLLKQ